MYKLFPCKDYSKGLFKSQTEPHRDTDKVIVERCRLGPDNIVELLGSGSHFVTFGNTEQCVLLQFLFFHEK
jgi:hypothetical protein